MSARQVFTSPTRAALARARVQAWWGAVGVGVIGLDRCRRRLNVTELPPSQPSPTRGEGTHFVYHAENFFL
jgi:hypothetical protein